MNPPVLRSASPAPAGRTARGFTLIELIIAVSIIAILTVIAVPSYQQYVVRANRAEVKAFLLDVAQRQEAWLGDRKTYTSLSNLYGGSGGTNSSLYVANDGTISQSASSSTLYVVTLARAGSSNVAVCPAMAAIPTTNFFDYVVVATPLTKTNGGLGNSIQSSDTRCATLCLSSTNIRGASGTDGASSCWQR